jgi:hypothetical protein
VRKHVGSFREMYSARRAFFEALVQVQRAHFTRTADESAGPILL